MFSMFDGHARTTQGERVRESEREKRSDVTITSAEKLNAEDVHVC